MKFASFGLVALGALLSYDSVVDARPMEKSRRNDGLLKMPLKRVHNLARTDIPADILHQQHVNRGIRRLARMTRRIEPSDEQLRANIAKRMYIPAKAPSTGAKSPVSKRMYIPVGKTRTGSVKTTRQHVRDFFSDLFGQVEARKHNHGAGNGNGNAATTGTGAGTGTAAGNGTGTGGAGFSQIDLDAEENNTLTNSDVTTSNGTTGLDIFANDVGYSAVVQIGTPPTKYEIIMDSGSSDFWVTASQCTIQNSKTACSSTLQTLGADTSSSFVDTKKAFSVTYGSGFVSGDIITDDVVLAGMTLSAHTMGVANVESVDFGGPNVLTDGLMGLAQQGLSQQATPTPVESLASAGTISAAITSFHLSRLADQLNDGEVTIGGLDDSKFDAATLVSAKNVNPDGFWEAAMDAITVNGQDTGLTGRTGIMDTGTTLIIAPPADAQAVHALIPGAQTDGQGNYFVPCTTTASVALTIGGTSFAIDPRDIAFSPVDPTDLTGTCLSGISAGEIGGAEEWLVGDVFLKNTYLSLDEGQNTLSFAKLVTA